MKISFKILAVFFVILGMTSACDLAELNENPNAPTRVEAASLLANAQNNLSDLYWGRALSFEFGMLMVQHLSQNEYASESRYQITPDAFDGSWNSWYSSPLMDIMEAKKIVESQRESQGDAVTNNRLATLTIMEVFAMQAITDMWGDVPYSEAFRISEITSPAYDTQESVYDQLITNLNTAISSITPTAAGFTEGDNIYDGNMAMWEKFGNSLKLRIAMRISDKDANRASTLASEAIAGGVLTSNAEAPYYVFGADQRIANPWHLDAKVAPVRDDFCISKTLTDSMELYNDPRLPFFAEENIDGNIVGMPYGLSDGDAFALKSVSSRPSDVLREATAPAKWMTYAEVLFLEAEAIERGFVSGVAADKFNDAIMASMAEWGVDNADAVTYATAKTAAYASKPWELVIGYEKWVSLYSNGLEAFAEWRRLDYPALVPAPESVLDADEIPLRAQYTNVEQSVNGTSVTNADQVDELTARVWWDAK
ncbi:SusD/RagB family nutrient-binding outer membrane lipoprotein [Marinigracilibium pacificum]|uniref:SusD/RagB family nutrient-binding outer membrane lipoprotein n=1 Tax=Marinigracilibium pacificum TaxID=2729599 RepID=A0A848J1Y6_9BACT|nr:SusD/RagB family nutrient-binding outer membrane lipoprotein [Marinigracilibium pacificum]NMM49348.1 SusD/RagB family nutrient-binding outer membrane lipoprotein [Marinigracilibium pacificum]